MKILTIFDYLKNYHISLLMEYNQSANKEYVKGKINTVIDLYDKLLFEYESELDTESLNEFQSYLGTMNIYV
jgi:hypothetical protein